MFVTCKVDYSTLSKAILKIKQTQHLVKDKKLSSLKIQDGRKRTESSFYGLYVVVIILPFFLSNDNLCHFYYTQTKIKVDNIVLIKFHGIDNITFYIYLE